MKIKSLLAVIGLAAIQISGLAQQASAPAVGSADSSAGPATQVAVTTTNIPIADLGKLTEYAFTQVKQLSGQAAMGILCPGRIISS